MILDDCIKEIQNLNGDYLYLGDGNWDALMYTVNSTKKLELKPRQVFLASTFKHRNAQVGTDVINQNINQNKKAGNLIAGNIDEVYNHFGRTYVSIFIGCESVETLAQCLEKGYGILQNLSYLIIKKKEGLNDEVVNFSNRVGARNLLFEDDNYYFLKRVAKSRPKIVRTESFKKT